MLLPLEKGRAGEEAPTFVVELVYLQRIDPWNDKGRPRLELPALDLPVSRTGFELHYSPRFRVEPQAGAFRVDDDPGPFAEALRTPVRGARRLAEGRSGRTIERRLRPAGARRQVQTRIRRTHGRRIAAGARRVSRVRTVGVPGVRADRRIAARQPSTSSSSA